MVLDFSLSWPWRLGPKPWSREIQNHIGKYFVTKLRPFITQSELELRGNKSGSFWSWRTSNLQLLSSMTNVPQALNSIVWASIKWPSWKQEEWLISNKKSKFHDKLMNAWILIGHEFLVFFIIMRTTL